jgi:LacI family transcriptional regulator
MSATATIADIAARAGVGTATVDRVLNKRPGVNAETMQRVLQVVAELGSPPQRGRPRKGENFRFAFVLPAEPSPFVELVDRLIAQAAGEFRHQHITEVTHRLATADAAQFAAELSQLADCDAVAVMAPDLPPVKLAINELVRTGVHVVTLFTDVAGSMRETHIGADNRAAGRTAGLLLGRMAAGTRDTLLLSSQATRLSAEIERRIGFAQVVEERFPKLKVLRTPDLPADDAGASRALLRFLAPMCRRGARGRQLQRGIGSAGVARALEGLGLSGSVGVVAHDFTDEHRALLGTNGLAYVLHQDIHYCISTAARVLRALCENVRGALNVVQPRVEILTAENLH